LPRAIRVERRGTIDRAIDFQFRSRAAHGYVQAPDGSSDYPNYATALTLLAVAMRGGEAGQRIPELRAYLIAAQQTDRLPWEADEGNVGSWGLVGGDPADPSSQRDGNLSATRLALEALAASGGAPRPLLDRAVRYLSRLQNPDGGFRFASQSDDLLNKAGAQSPDDGTSEVVARSYGTTTADGLCALLACGVSITDPTVQAAIAWLDAHDVISEVPGFPEAGAAISEPSAREGLRFYYFAAFAGAMVRCPDAKFSERGNRLAEHILNLQKADGSWVNSSSSQREDDPLIATAWTVTALSSLRQIGNADAADR
jgi:squalene-hopene/tetraprenyl-beta-curcumene cyclase